MRSGVCAIPSTHYTYSTYQARHSTVCTQTNDVRIILLGIWTSSNLQKKRVSM